MQTIAGAILQVSSAGSSWHDGFRIYRTSPGNGILSESLITINPMGALRSRTPLYQAPVFRTGQSSAQLAKSRGCTSTCILAKLTDLIPKRCVHAHIGCEVLPRAFGADRFASYPMCTRGREQSNVNWRCGVWNFFRYVLNSGEVLRMISVGFDSIPIQAGTATLVRSFKSGVLPMVSAKG